MPENLERETTGGSTTWITNPYISTMLPQQESFIQFSVGVSPLNLRDMKSTLTQNLFGGSMGNIPKIPNARTRPIGVMPKEKLSKVDWLDEALNNWLKQKE